MFETAQERVKLLKSGVSEMEIERMYLQSNGFRSFKRKLPITVECEIMITHIMNVGS